MQLRVVLVRPEHDLNVGSVARAMKNFGFTELALVKPVAKMGFDATLFAKHSEDVLKNAKKFSFLRAALKGCDVAVATTGVPERYRSRLKKCVLLPKLPALLKKARKVAIVFGSESIGLSQKELEECDVVITIPTASLHKVLNLSHAVAVVLYELYSRMRAEEVFAKRLASREKRLVLEKFFAKIVGKTKSVRDKKKVLKAFKNVLERSCVEEDEAQALLALLGPLSRRLMR